MLKNFIFVAFFTEQKVECNLYVTIAHNFLIQWCFNQNSGKGKTSSNLLAGKTDLVGYITRWILLLFFQLFMVEKVTGFDLLHAYNINVCVVSTNFVVIMLVFSCHCNLFKVRSGVLLCTFYVLLFYPLVLCLFLILDCRLGPMLTGIYPYMRMWILCYLMMMKMLMIWAILLVHCNKVFLLATVTNLKVYHYFLASILNILDDSYQYKALNFQKWINTSDVMSQVSTTHFSV